MKLEEQIKILKKALERIALPANARCGCSLPCTCDSPAAEAIRAEAYRDIAEEALAATAAQPTEQQEPVATGCVRVLRTIPTAWYRGIQYGGSPDNPPEWDVDMHFGDDKPEGDGWIPLFRETASYCAGLIAQYDDGSEVFLNSYSGGASPDGAWAELSLDFVEQGILCRTRKYRDVELSAAPVAQPQEIDERAAFEKHFKHQSYKRSLWLGWQARAALKRRK